MKRPRYKIGEIIRLYWDFDETEGTRIKFTLPRVYAVVIRVNGFIGVLAVKRDGDKWRVWSDERDISKGGIAGRVMWIREMLKWYEIEEKSFLSECGYDNLEEAFNYIQRTGEFVDWNDVIY